MCKHAHRHSIFCFMPPHVFDQIARNGNAEQRGWALDALQMDHTMRNTRSFGLQAPAPAPMMTMADPEAGTPQRTIYSVGNTMNLPGTLQRSEGQAATDDIAVNEAYDGLGATYDFYWQIFSRNSIDDQGLPLKAIVHFGQRFNNAFWDGAEMIFGDGDGHFFGRYTVSVDVIGHELTHGVTEKEANLVYMNQSGALNESVSDVFGVLIKQYALKQTAEQADWLIGAGLLTPQVQGVALRSMRAPGTAYDDPMLGKDPQPADFKNYIRTMQDNGGVHLNSGIPNRAFYLAATAIGGYAWERAGRIWYDTLQDRRLKPNASFAAFARLTVANAAMRYGVQSTEAAAVHDAWNTVGVRVARA